MSLSEPPPPQRGQTAAERAADRPPPPETSTATASPVEWVARNIGPGAFTSQAQSRVVKTLLLVFYPVWIVLVLVGGLAYAALYYPLWVLLAPVRARQKRNDPEAYEKSQGR